MPSWESSGWESMHTNTKHPNVNAETNALTESQNHCPNVRKKKIFFRFLFGHKYGTKSKPHTEKEKKIKKCPKTFFISTLVQDR